MNDLVARAISFASRVHQGHYRDDGQTPYIAHPMRVCMIVRQLFDISDAETLATAVLHDSIEDTPTDFDDIHEEFGLNVATWVAALTKDMRLIKAEREIEYNKVLLHACWQVQACKLADIYDNINDSRTMTSDYVRKMLKKSIAYIDSIHAGLKPEVLKAHELTLHRWGEVAHDVGWVGAATEETDD